MIPFLDIAPRPPRPPRLHELSETLGQTSAEAADTVPSTLIPLLLLTVFLLLAVCVYTIVVWRRYRPVGKQ